MLRSRAAVAVPELVATVFPPPYILPALQSSSPPSLLFCSLLSRFHILPSTFLIFANRPLRLHPPRPPPPPASLSPPTMADISFPPSSSSPSPPWITPNPNSDPNSTPYPSPPERSENQSQESSSPKSPDAPAEAIGGGAANDDDNSALPLPPPSPPFSSSPSPSPSPSPPRTRSSAVASSSSAAKMGLPSPLHLSFNQDHGCFAVGTDGGFRIFNCDPFREIFRRDFDGGGIGVVEMLFRCNILALVGGGPQPNFSPNKVMIWDDHQSRCIGELSFRSEVRAVRLRRDRIIVVLDHKIFVYNFADLKLVQQIETVPNPKGLCAVSQQQGSLVLVCPGGQRGQIRIEHYATKKTKFIMAHDSRIACFALSQDGRLIATASSKGTLVRIFSTIDGMLLQEVRRGADRAEIYSLAFSANMQWLAVSSDKGTVHVFSIKVNLGLTVNDKPRPAPELNNSGSQLSLIKGVLPRYFNSEWSVAQFRLNDSTQYIVAFGHQKNTIVIVGMDGSSYRCQFDPVKGGEMIQLECHHFLKPHGAAAS